jgi:hypothetical protein
MLTIVIVEPIPSRNHATIKPSITPSGKHRCKTVIGGNPSTNRKSRRNPTTTKLPILAIQREIEAQDFAHSMILVPLIMAPNFANHILFNRFNKTVSKTQDL